MQGCWHYAYSAMKMQPFSTKNPSTILISTKLSKYSSSTKTKGFKLHKDIRQQNGTELFVLNPHN